MTIEEREIEERAFELMDKQDIRNYGKDILRGANRIISSESIADIECNIERLRLACRELEERIGAVRNKASAEAIKEEEAELDREE